MVTGQDLQQQIANNLAVVRRQIAGAAARSPWRQEVRLLAVSKNHPPGAVMAAAACGVGDFAENRVQEARAKISQTPAGICWHLVGHLQTNKAGQAVRLFDLIHSLDSQRVAEAVNRAAAAVGKRQAVLMQVNVAGERQKFGISTREAMELARFIAGQPNLDFCGLMVMAPFYDDPELARPVFSQGRRLFGEMAAAVTGFTPRWLSMGMSGDYQVAIEEGANIVRIGTAIFGERNYG
ncbi:MAG: YggS family pyridoxal phosphate-dependent enzyme [Negativicutes bacterium]|nr:YggS family pyridoxal phosphate-dependent enzyme [Negativicutes bacterium]